MHLGNVCAALLSWYSAKSRGGDWLLRIEDLDPQRSRREYARQIEDDLIRLGLEWDEGGIEGRGNAGPYVQSERGEIYEEALRRLAELGLTYPCYCTRADIMATQAPHQSDGRIVYSGKCRPKDFEIGLQSRTGQKAADSEDLTLRSSERRPSTRIMVKDEDICFVDRICGARRVNLAEHCGDFVVRRADGAWAYQLAVVVDDALMGVTEVVRGEDLLLSSAQQIYLYRLLGYQPPEFAHFPLIVNSAGQRLSKRDKSQSLEYLFRHFSPEEIIGQAAMLTGLRRDATPLKPEDLL
ncbi:MAG: tRNA glutamyl-Q(34) synthetase GluQRS [Muribaculaceae bacterium]|nr:tRNA glutamyl-Q(34) synthetase GluQRS [Muribaculaceae bacterium]